MRRDHNDWNFQRLKKERNAIVMTGITKTKENIGRDHNDWNNLKYKKKQDTVTMTKIT